jgi:hypothetical protein
MMRGMMGGGMMHMFDGTILVLDAAGRTVASLGDLDNLPPTLRSGQDGWPMEWNGERIGTLVLEGTPMTGLDSDSLVSAVTRACSRRRWSRRWSPLCWAPSDPPDHAPVGGTQPRRQRDRVR